MKPVKLTYTPRYKHSYLPKKDSRMVNLVIGFVGGAFILVMLVVIIGGALGILG